MCKTNYNQRYKNGESKKRYLSRINFPYLK